MSGKPLHTPRAVVGSGLFPIAQFLKLESIHGSGGQVLISERGASDQDILLQDPWPIRGQENIDLVKSLYPHLGLEENHRRALFLKEGKWREFGGRARPETLLPGEAFYTSPKARVNLEECFSLSPEILEEINTTPGPILRDSVVGITGGGPERYQLSTAQGLSLLCDQLYWGEDPWNFLDVYTHKDNLGPNLIKFCTDPEMPSSLRLDFEFSTPITNRTETVFIPLSYTHEMGHFIGDFFMDMATPRASFFTFVNPNEENEEGLSRKIRLFKRNIKRVFPNFRKDLTRERISLDKQNGSPRVDDALFFHGANPYRENLFFIGPNGALEDDRGAKASHFVRGLLGLERGSKGRAGKVPQMEEEITL